MAGGKGTRLRPVTGDLPKPMVPLLGKPVMAHIVELLRDSGITEICAGLGYNPDPIMEHFGDGGAYGVRLHYHVEEEPLGTAGGVRACMDQMGTGDFLVVSGDAVCDFDLRGLIRFHQEGAPAATLALRPDPEPLRYGLVLTDASGRVLQFIEKPGWERVITDLVNTGIYVLTPEAMALVPENTAFDFARDLFPLLLARGDKLLGAVMEGYWCDIGTPRAYYQCCLDALDGKLRIKSAWEAARRRPGQPGGESPCRTRLSVACRDRARVMRHMSEALQDSGADYTDGLRINRERCALHIYPNPNRPAICIECAGQDAEFSEELALAVEELVRSFG